MNKVSAVSAAWKKPACFERNLVVIGAGSIGRITSYVAAGLKATLKEGRVEQGNFDNYSLLRIGEMPQVEVHILPSTAAPTGIGEPGVPPVAPAVANAIAAATGKRLTRMPFRTSDLLA